MADPYPIGAGAIMLVTLQEVKDHLNISDTSQDGELFGFITAAAAYVQNITGPILPASYTEVHDGRGPSIVLYNPPILSVTSVIEYVGPVAYTLTQAELGTGDDTGQFSFSLDNPNAGIITRRYTGGIVGNFAPGVSNVQVAYVAGRAALPPDVRMAILQDIAGLFQTSQLAPNPYFNNPNMGNTPLNPIGLFPRVEAILTASAHRSPAIA